MELSCNSARFFKWVSYFVPIPKQVERARASASYMADRADHACAPTDKMEIHTPRAQRLQTIIGRHARKYHRIRARFGRFADFLHGDNIDAVLFQCCRTFRK